MTERCTTLAILRSTHFQFVRLSYSRLCGMSRCTGCPQQSCLAANQTASATTGFSAATLPHLLIAVLAIAGVMTMGGGLVLFGSGFSAASLSLVSTLPLTGLTVEGVSWGNESWPRIIHCFCASSPSRSLAGPIQLTAVLFSCKGWSLPLLPDHAELAAAEQAQREAARARRGGRPIHRALTIQQADASPMAG